MDVMRAIDSNIELDGDFGEQIANEIHIAAVILFKRMGLDEGIEADDVRLAALDGVAQLPLERADSANVAIQLRELGEPRRCAEQPAFQLGAINAVVIEHGLDPAVQFIAIIFEADEQNTAAAEYMLATKRTAQRERYELQQSQRRLADAARGNDRGKKPAAELIAEKPLTRRDRAGLVAGIPFIEAQRRLRLIALVSSVIARRSDLHLITRIKLPAFEVAVIGVLHHTATSAAKSAKSAPNLCGNRISTWAPEASQRRAHA